MHSILLTSLGVLAGVCLFTGVHHLSIGLRRPVQTTHVLIAAMSFLITFYVIAKLGAYRAESAAELVTLRRWEISFGMLFFAVFPWFVATYAGMRQRAPLFVLSALALLFFSFNLALPFGIAFIEMPQLQRLSLPWGEIVADLRVHQRSVLFQMAWLTIILNLMYAAYCCRNQYRRGERRRATLLALAIGVFMALVFFNQAVNLGIVQFTHTAEFGFIALVLLLSAELGRELRESGDALKASEARFRSLIDQSPFSIQVLAPDGRTLQVNSSWEKLWGTHFEALGGYNLLKDRQLVDKGVMPYIERGFAGEAAEIPPIVYNPKDTPEVPGGPFRDRWVRAFIYPIKDDVGHVREIILMHEDVTDRHRTEEAIKSIAAGVSAQTGEIFFRDLVTHLAKLFGADYAFVGLLDPGNRRVVTTCAVYAHGKIAPNMSYDLEHTPCANVIGQSTCAYPSNVQQMFPKDKLLTDMGVEGYIGTPLFDTAGTPIGLIVVLHSKPLVHIEQVREILEIFAARTGAEIQRIGAENKLQKSEARLAALLDIAPGAIISIDAQQNIIVFNREAQHIFGYSAQEVMGRSLDRLMPEHCRSAHHGAVVRFGAEPDDVRRTMGRPEIRGLRKSGEEFPAEAAISKLTLDGQPIYTVALQDITERKHAEEELHRHREQLEELVVERTAQLAMANKELESFSYSVSHDLRAPLRAMHGFSAALIDDCGTHLDEQCRSYLQRIQTASEKMGLLIDDLLQLSRITREELRHTAVDLCTLARQVAEGLQQSAPERRVEWVIADTCPAQGDARLLTVALNNLLGNAWKFTGPQQKARIEFGQLSNEGETIYYVRDNGAGFNMAYADKLFKPFQRLHSNEQFQGTGVGLSIVERIIHRHGGRIWAEGAEGTGARFYFTLPHPSDDEHPIAKQRP